jgi:FkbM family methyltransferase
MEAVKFDGETPWGKWRPAGWSACALGLIDALPVNGFFRRIAFLLRKPVKTGKQDFYDREIWGLKLRLAARGNLTEQRWLTMARFHDAEERRALAARLGPGSVFLDVGANAGFYTFWVLSLQHAGLRALAVEPTPVMLERMAYNLALNRIGDRVTLFPCAVTPEPCEVFIDLHSENIGQTGIQARGGGLKVAGRPLSDILREAGVDKVDAMKIDIEGFEVPVLEAFFSTAPENLWPGLIIAETVGDGGNTLTGLLRAKGYTLARRTRMNGIFMRHEA